MQTEHTGLVSQPQVTSMPSGADLCQLLSGKQPGRTKRKFLDKWPFGKKSEQSTSSSSLFCLKQRRIEEKGEWQMFLICTFTKRRQRWRFVCQCDNDGGQWRFIALIVLLVFFGFCWGEDEKLRLEEGRRARNQRLEEEGETSKHTSDGIMGLMNCEYLVCMQLWLCWCLYPHFLWCGWSAACRKKYPLSFFFFTRHFSHTTSRFPYPDTPYICMLQFSWTVSFFSLILHAHSVLSAGHVSNGAAGEGKATVTLD